MDEGTLKDVVGAIVENGGVPDGEHDLTLIGSDGTVIEGTLEVQSQRGRPTPSGERTQFGGYSPGYSANWDRIFGKKDEGGGKSN